MKIHDKISAMKKLLYLLIAAVLTLADLPGCAKQNSGAVYVVATTDALYEMTKELAGGSIEVRTSGSGQTEIHDFEPTAKQIAAIKSAKLVIANGLDLESWLPESPNIKYASEGIEPRESDGVVDPHMWLSPAHAALMAENVKKYLAEAFPEMSGEINKNYSEFSVRLLELSREYKNYIPPGKIIVTSHDAFSYLALDFEIITESILGIHEEGEPGPSRVAEIIEFCKINNIKRIYTEYGEEDKTAETIARECGIAVTPLYTMETSEDGSGYIERLTKNLELILGDDDV